MFELFVFGSVAFWILLAVEALFLLACVINEKGILATLSVLAFALILYFFGQVNIFSPFVNHPIEISLSIVGYFAIGFLWSLFKWRDYLLTFKEEYEKFRSRWLKNNGLPASTEEIPAALKNEYANSVRSNNHPIDFTAPPQIHDNKSRWLRWATFWPFSVIAYLVGDLIVNIFNAIYRRISGFLQKMSDDIYASMGVDRDTKSK